MLAKNDYKSYFFLLVMVVCLAMAVITSGNYPRALAFLLASFASAELVVEFSTWPDEKKGSWNRGLKVILLVGSGVGAYLFDYLA